jgi:purine nucleosidase
MQGRGAVRPPLGIALEADLGHRIDAVLAVAMLNGLNAKGESRTIALCLSRPSIEAAQLADVVAGFYTPRPVGGSSMIGMPEGPLTSSPPPLAAIMARTGPEGRPVHTSNIQSVLDTADNAVHIRNVLLAQFDGNAAIVLAGPATGIARLLTLYGARPQIEAKAARLVMAIGAFGPGAAVDPDVRADVESLRTVLADWPTPIVMVGREVGEAVPYPGAAIDTGLAWAPVHPVADAYRAFAPMPYDAPASALAATLHAVHPELPLFRLSEPGTISVADDGRTSFAPTAGGRHRYLIAEPAQKARVESLYTELVSARPVPRPGRRGGPPPPAPQQQAPRPQVPPVAPPPPANPSS